MPRNNPQRLLLERELDNAISRIFDCLVVLNTEDDVTAAQFDENLARYHYWMARRERIEYELQQLDVAPSKRKADEY